LKVRRLAGALGAEIEAVDLAARLSPDAVAEIRRALLEHQSSSSTTSPLAGAILAFARHMGRPIEYPFVKGIEGFPRSSR